MFCTIRSVQHDFDVLEKYAMQIGLEENEINVNLNYMCHLTWVESIFGLNSQPFFNAFFFSSFSFAEGE